MDFDLLGQKLRILRKKLGLTIDAVAIQTGLSNALISGLERGTGGNPQLGGLLRLSALYGVPLTYLIDSNQLDYNPHVELFTKMIATLPLETAMKITKITEILI